jgi:hypothetical protein
MDAKQREKISEVIRLCNEKVEDQRRHEAGIRGGLLGRTGGRGRRARTEHPPDAEGHALVGSGASTAATGYL